MQLQEFCLFQYIIFKFQNIIRVSTISIRTFEKKQAKNEYRKENYRKKNYFIGKYATS